MTQNVPVLIAISGKRNLKDQEAAVRRALVRAFTLLDKRLTTAPKVLLTGLAAGADTIAAELVLGRPQWLIAAVLPLPRAVYLEDFPDQPGHGDAPSPRRQIEDFLAHPQVKVRELAVLTDPATGMPATAEALARQADHPNPLRDQHYEQLGLWLAETATLLIAVKPEEEAPGLLGGTARVLAYRLSGKPDRDARQVMAASREVPLPDPLDGGRGAPAWLVDAPMPNGARRRQRHGFVPLLPPPDEARTIKRPFSRRLAISLRSAHAFDVLAARNPDTSAMAPPVWPAEPPNPIAEVTAIRRTISTIQGHDKNRLTRATIALAGLFCLAVGLYTASTEFWRDTVWGLVPYLTAVVLAVLLHELIEYHRWQRFAEDYRAVNEALRVQRVWWCAGIAEPAHRVDRHFLPGARGLAALPRRGVRGIVDWVLLACLPREPDEDWARVDGDNAASWVGEQTAYFRTRAGQRKREVGWIQISAWAAFFCGQTLAVWVLLYRLAELEGSPGRYLWLSAAAGALMLLLIAGVRQAVRRWRPGPVVRHRLWAAAIALPLGFGLGHLYHWATAFLAPGSPVLFDYLVALSVALLSAVAGSIRFLSDKLAWETEAHRYEDALALFEDAREAFAEIDAESLPQADERTRKREIVLTLGKAALAENEYWLRAHRERPVEQAIGG
ncbi:MAG TPA: hypothetical protein VND87_18270 [Stellaceae bacterium]|nr:hypothetical protein [Stellaceae bacterium]